MCVFVITKTIVLFRSKGELNLAGFPPPSGQNSFCKNNGTNSKILIKLFSGVGEKMTPQKKTRPGQDFPVGIFFEDLGKKHKSREFLYKFGQKMKISAKISGNKREIAERFPPPMGVSPCFVVSPSRTPSTLLGEGQNTGCCKDKLQN